MERCERSGEQRVFAGYFGVTTVLSSDAIGTHARGSLRRLYDEPMVFTVQMYTTKFTVKTTVFTVNTTVFETQAYREIPKLVHLCHGRFSARESTLTVAGRMF
jgi:chromosome condensin MukBEF MukE localization factor